LLIEPGRDATMFVAVVICRGHRAGHRDPCRAAFMFNEKEKTMNENTTSDTVADKLFADLAAQLKALDAEIAESYHKLSAQADSVRKEIAARLADLEARREKAQTEFFTRIAAHIGELDARYDALEALTRPAADDARARADEEMAGLKAQIADARGKVAAQHRAHLDQLRSERLALQTTIARANETVRRDLEQQAEAIDLRIDEAKIGMQAAHEAYVESLRQSVHVLELQAEDVEERIEQAEARLEDAHEADKEALRKSVADLRLRATALDVRIQRSRAELHAARQAREDELRESIADLKEARLSAEASELARIDERLKRQEAELAASEARVRSEQAALTR
jgi:chromosome segregation ATPase